MNEGAARLQQEIGQRLCLWPLHTYSAPIRGTGCIASGSALRMRMRTHQKADPSPRGRRIDPSIKPI